LILILATIAAAVAVGYLSGRTLRGFPSLKIHWGILAVAGVILQVAPINGDLGRWVLLGSFALLIAFCLRNVATAGFVLILLGVILNMTVIAVDHGMPVPLHVIQAAHRQGILIDLQENGGAKHHLATSADRLLPLADSIGIGPPFDQAVSVGDICVHLGVAWFIVAGMPRRKPAAAEVGLA
jgi:Family of unknown function (DUF5317)